MANRRKNGQFGNGNNIGKQFKPGQSGNLNGRRNSAKDILNKYFDGQYLELEKINNFAFAIYNEERYDSKFIHESVNFLHYNGKGKPWLAQYLIYDSSQIYQKEFRKLNLDFYHIVFNLKVKVLVTFLQDVFSFKILKLEKPSLYLYLSIKALFKKLRF